MTKRSDPVSGLRRPSSTFLPKFLWSQDARQTEALHALSDRAELLHRSAERAKKEQSERLRQLEDEVGRLLLVNHALVQELTRLGVIDAAALESAMKTLDLADGVEDGQVTRTKPSPKPRKRPTT
ncbi:MAG: hypothetical protein JNL12_05295 [Planctomycetes bacterium]|nr:hypothetical protein [Planctomycetota bacterium]